MVQATLCLFPLLTVVQVYCSPFASPKMHMHEKRSGIPAEFIAMGAAAPNETLSLRVALIQGKFSGLEESLYAVSTPSSPSYGKFLTKEEVEAFVTPSDAATSAVQAWIKSHNLNVAAVSPAGDWFSLDVTVQQANELLSADFKTYQHHDTNLTAVRTLSYSLPAELQPHIAFVHPTVSFPRTLSRASHRGFRQLPNLFVPGAVGHNKKNGTAPDSCEQQVTPVCLQDLYNIPRTPANQKNNSIAVTGFLNEYANEADLSEFLIKFRPDMPADTTFTFESINGGVNPQGSGTAGGEANLDVQYTVGLSTGVPVQFISEDPNGEKGILDDFLATVQFLLNEPTTPNVVTTSYGLSETSDEESVPLLINICNAFAQLGARGTTVLFASGDGGVAGYSDDCGSDSNFSPSFPSSCPFVTSVGSTTGIKQEQAASFSSGGFSNIFPRPSYQEKAVSNYLDSLGDTYSGRFNASGRAFPDVSALGIGLQIVANGSIEAIGGTSASSPIWASIVGLLNDELIGKGMPVVGFLNPLIYEHPEALKDITLGSNPGCGSDGFSAAIVPGYDPVTGMGSPRYDRLRAVLGLDES